MERRMDKFEDAQKEDSERFHQIEMEIKGQHAIFVPRAEFGAYCSLAKQGGKRFFDPPTECG
jgi:hypothetical protein